MVKTKAIAPEGTSPTGDSVKKPAVKRAIKSKTTSELHKNPKPIKRAEPGREFHLVDGRNVADLKELADMLDDMSIAVWNHHVNQGRNDFANWVRDVFEEVELAQRITDASSSHHAQVVIYRIILERT